jgi:hypothetical protein
MAQYARQITIELIVPMAHWRDYEALCHAHAQEPEPAFAELLAEAVDHLLLHLLGDDGEDESEDEDGA